jgi:hypothetical protein
MTDRMIRDGCDSFPEVFKKYNKLTDLYDKAHTANSLEETLDFFND